MRILASALVATITTFGLVNTAQAADMTGADIKALISSKSVYLETTADSVAGKPGQGVIYYAEDGTSLYKTPGGAMWHGKWTIKDNTNCTAWTERPGTACSKYDKTGDVMSIIDSATGKTRAKIVKTAPGNPEKLAP